MNLLKSSVFVGVVLGSLVALGQKAAVTDIPTNEETTISIKKGEAASKGDRQFEIVEGNADIEGDPNVLIKEARANWKKACSEWKKEIKELNKDNKIISLDCGKMTCVAQGAEGQLCTSKASYKVKTKIN